MARVRARIDPLALQANFAALRRIAAGSEICAVVKANAYGHGLAIAASALFAAGCRRFATTDAEEAHELLACIDRVAGQKAEVSVIALSGVFDAHQARLLAEDDRIEAVVYDLAGVRRLIQARFCGKLWLKLETGMHRLGAEDPTPLLRAAESARLRIAGVISHLCCAESPQHPRTKAQLARFARLTEGLGLPRSLANSAATFLLPEARFELVRPGIALYGALAIPEASSTLVPAMRLEARVLQVRKLLPGDAVSYEASFVASQPMKVAVVAAGYADGVPRALSNRGFAVDARGRKLAILGRVCMDYTVLDLSNAPEVAVGDWVCFWGAKELRVEEQARLAGTIAYELLTGVGARVVRIEEEGCCLG